MSPDAIQYEIDRSTDDTNWTEVAVTNIGDPTNYTDSGLIGQSSYYYRVQAINDISESAFSTPVPVTTPMAAPGMPLSFATGTVTATSVILGWTADTDTDDGGAVATFAASYSSDEGQSWNIFNPSGGTLTSSATSVTINDLDPSSIYLFELTATNSVGTSDPAGPIGAKTPALPQGVPTLSVAVNDTTGSNGDPWNSALLTWTYSGQDSPTFEFEQEDQSAGEDYHAVPDTLDFGDGNSAIATGLNPEDTYSFRVRADFPDGTVSAWSAATFTLPVASPAPEVTVDTAVDEEGGDLPSLVVGWSGAPVDGAVQIEFTSDAYPDAGWISYDPSPSEVNAYPVDYGSGEVINPNDQGCIWDPGVRLDSGTYNYRVRGFDEDGQPTAWSTTQSGSLGDGTGPDLTASAVSDTSITMNWTGYAPANNSSSYTLFSESTWPGNTQDVYPSLDGGGIGSVSGTTDSSVTQAMSYNLSNLSPGVTYCYVMATEISGGSYALFSRLDVSTTGVVAPIQPGVLNGNASSGAVAFNWTDNSNDESGFEIQRSDDSDFSDTDDIETFYTDVDQNSYVDSTAQKDSVYYYRVRAIGDTSGNYDSNWSGVTVNTPGVSMVITAPENPAFNPEIWVDSSEIDPSTGDVDPPSVGDPNLVPVTFNVPLGADEYGTATATWDSSIRLYQMSGGVLSQVDSPYSWNVSSGLSSQTFYAQATSFSANLGDQDFDLTTSLFLLAARPATGPDPETNPVSNLPATDKGIIVTVTPGQNIIVGQQLTATVTAGPKILFNAATKYRWVIPDDPIAGYEYQKYPVKVLLLQDPNQPAMQGTKSSITFYWWHGATLTGTNETIDVVLTSGAASGTGETKVTLFQPTVKFSGAPSKDNPVAGIGAFYEPSNVNPIAPPNTYLHLGGAASTLASAGIQYNALITTPVGGAGQVGIFQTVKWSGTRTLQNGTVQTGSTQIPGSDGYLEDAPWPYKNIWKGVPADDSTAIPDSDDKYTLYNWADSFSIGITQPDGALVKSLQSNWSAMAYLMYQPTTANSIPVPISVFTWGGQASFTSTGNVVTGSEDSSGKAVSGGAPTGFPEPLDAAKKYYEVWK